MKDKVHLLAGTRQLDTTPWAPFDPRASAFLADVSAELLRRPEIRSQDGAAAFGFWCRKSRLEQLAQRHAASVPRLGQGLIFHLAPSNVPALFAYTFAISLLAGNANLVRLSNRRTEEEALLLEVLNQVLERPEHAAVKQRTALLTYPRDAAQTAAFCARCDGRVIWGGDETVAAVRAMPMPAHAVELCFPRRWSLALFSQAALAGMDGDQLDQLSRRFYNDTYQLDQNACSSPQLLLWLEDGGDPACRPRWWEALAAEAARRYPLGPFQAARKLERLCLGVMEGKDGAVKQVERFRGNLLYVASLTELPGQLDQLQGGFGLFYQCSVKGLEDLLPRLTPRVQTLVCEGLDPRKTAAWLAERNAKGACRVVRPGQALTLDTVWDGKDLIAGLSRMIGGEE